MADTNLKVGLRYAGNAAATLFTVLGALSVIPQDKVADLVSALHQFNDSIVTAYGALLKMWVILGPVAIVLLAKMGISSSTVAAMLERIKIIAAADTPEAKAAKVALVSAAADPKLGTVAVINPALAPVPSTPANVVASMADLPK